MPRNIPVQGIEAYMDGEVRRWTKENWANKPYSALNNRWFWLPFVVFVLGLDILDDWHGKTLGIRSYALDLGLLGGAYFLMLLLERLRIQPLQWGRYTFRTFTDRYGGWYMPSIETTVSNVRRDAPLADFELAVLEESGTEKPKKFGIILFQTLDRMGKVAPELEDGKPLLVCDDRGWVREFGEAYAPFGSQQLKPA